MSLWLVTGYEEARVALTDRRLSKSSRHAARALRGTGVAMDPTLDLGSHMLNTDPPDHGRLRRPVTIAFSARRVEQLRPRVQQIADELIDEMARGGEGAQHREVDLLSALAFPLAVTVICELLGVPVQDRERFRDWSHAALTPAYADGETISRGEGIAALRDYFTDLVTTRRGSLREDRPVDAQPDLLSALIAACDDEGRLTEAELVATAMLMLIAGHDSSLNLIGNGMLALLRHPEQLAVLRDRPELLPQAVEELLRYDGPGETAARIAVEDTSIGEATVPAGSIVNIGLGAANRDPRQFTDPDRLDVTRAPRPHLAFGHGVHYCVGAALARMETEIAIGSLLGRFPDLVLACRPDQLHWRISMFRGVTALPIRISQRPLQTLTRQGAR